MNLYVWWGVAFVIFSFTAVDAFIISKLKYKRKRVLTPNKALILGTFSSATILFCPLYLEEFTDSVGFVEWGKTIMISIQHSIRLFAFDGDYMDIVGMVNGVEGLDNVIPMLYTGLGAFLYFFAPLLTFGFILSFFQNFSAYNKYVLSVWKHAHVFSELNEKSLALAKSINSTYNGVKSGRRLIRKALIVFTDVLDKDDEDSLELLEEAKEMGAILLSKDLESIRYRFKKFSIRKVSFYLISDDEEEKLRHAESIIHDYDIDDVELRVFSDDIRSELLLSAKDVKHMKVIRVNDIQSLIYHNLDVHGVRLFHNARDSGDGDKVISAVIVGLGKYGIEMMKALIWFCQVGGYKIKINAFDVDENAAAKFEHMCPELMSSEFNGQFIEGEACYDVKIHGGIDSQSPAFTEELLKIKDATYIFVCLGNDADNLSTAVNIRSLCERVHYTDDHHKPDIETVIYDSNIRDAMGVKWDVEREDPTESNIDGVANFKNQHYNIHMIGDLDHFYCVDTLIDSDLVQAGLQVHLRWGDAQSYWKYEYNYRSSIAKAMHERLRVRLKLDIPGVDKAWDDRTQEEKLAIGKVEHVRWNAYMRTDGYQFSGSKEKSSRNDLGKEHNNLVAVTELSDDDLRKDA